MKTVRISESGALDRLGSFLQNKQAALADRLQQLLDSFSPRDIAQPDGTVWPAPQGVGAGKFVVEPVPAQAGKELVYVSDGTGMEVMVDPMVALPYLQNVPPEGITPEKIWDLLNEASAETETSSMLFSPQDEAAESEWEKQFMARRAQEGSPDAPRIYVGTYAKYNNGSIKGAWLDLEDYASAEDFYAAAKELHSDEQDPELMFQDWENIPDWAIGESHIDPKFWEYMEAMQGLLGSGREEAFNLFVDAFYPSGGAPNDIQGMVQDFEDRYRGEYRSMEEFAEQFISDIGIENIQNKEFYFDAESFGRDLGYDGYYEVDEEEAESEGLRGGAGVYDPENQFTGYQTLTELAESYFDEGLIGADQLNTYFDYEKFANDLELGGDYTFIDGHVFSAS